MNALESGENELIDIHIIDFNGKQIPLKVRSTFAPC